MRYVCCLRSFVAASWVAGCVLVPTASAQGLSEPAIMLIAPDLLPTPGAQPPRPASPNPTTSPIRDAAQRPGALLPLYASLGVLQGLDIHSTSRGLAAGGREANPVMGPVVTNRAAFIAVKAAATVGVVWVSEKLWRRQNRKAAVVLTALTNVGLAAVVAHNYRAGR